MAGSAPVLRIVALCLVGAPPAAAQKNSWCAGQGAFGVDHERCPEMQDADGVCPEGCDVTVTASSSGSSSELCPMASRLLA